MEDRKNFLKKIKELKPYMVKFDKFGIMKPKVYPLDCIVRRDNR